MAVAASGRLAATIPGSDVPQSAQTLFVLVVGSLLGARDGTLALGAYLVLGTLGLPFFADGESGWQHLWGPTAGYLGGFVMAAGLLGRLADLGVLRSWGPTFVATIGAHVVILALGWMRLALTLGAVPAFTAGVEPFVLGGILKSLVATGIILLVPRLVGESRGPAGGGQTRV